MARTVEEIISTFWHEPRGRAGASAEEIGQAERRIGFEFPPEFRALLRLRNGGVSNFDLFGEILFSPIRGVATEDGNEDIAGLYLRGGEETLPPSVVIFAADASAWFGFDYRAKPLEPSVLHWSEYEDQPVQLARTFRAFLTGLAGGRG